MASYKVWILVFALMLAFFSIFSMNFFEKGVMIKSVERNSTETEQGLAPGMIITAINSISITNMGDYLQATSNIFQDNASEQRITIQTKTSEFIFLKQGELSIIVEEVPKTKITTGLDLSGGARALIRPVNLSLSASNLTDLITITSERFNVYGLKDITVKPVRDLQGNNYMLIEIAGATPFDLESLISNQGKFEAKIGNETVFIGGRDITHVERSGQQSGIQGCSTMPDGGENCRFSFLVSLTQEAAQRHAEITSRLTISSENPAYLSEKLDLYVDDNLADSLFISKNLKGQETTQVSVQGSGAGSSRQEAIKNAELDMKKLQTVLITGSLPYKLEIVKLDTISPNLGKQFTKNLALLAVIVFAIISIVLFLKYRKIKITLAVILTMFSEVFITLGIAALMRWNLDAPSIAGIIAGMGTGVNDQIVIIDESVSNESMSMKERIKRAFFIIIGAFFTIIAAMLPLFWAGAGMLKGFALTTIISVLVGILITRPAFADILKKISE